MLEDEQDCGGHGPDMTSDTAEGLSSGEPYEAFVERVFPDSFQSVQEDKD